MWISLLYGVRGQKASVSQTVDQSSKVKFLYVEGFIIIDMESKRTCLLSQASPCMKVNFQIYLDDAAGASERGKYGCI